jgi:hypothetical protein
MKNHSEKVRNLQLLSANFPPLSLCCSKQSGMAQNGNLNKIMSFQHQLSPRRDQLRKVSREQFRQRVAKNTLWFNVPSAEVFIIR